MYKEKTTYRSEIIAALKILGGQGHWKSICDVIKERDLLPSIRTNQDWESNVRAELQRHSSDTDSYRGGKDIFFSAQGIGHGIWGIKDTDLLNTDDLFDYMNNGEYTSTEYVEGAQKTIMVNTFERNPSLRKESIKIHGVDCKICAFNFERHYGIRGKDFIEIHHIVPISHMKRNYSITPYDLLPVCSNCHSIIQRKSQQMVGELRQRSRRFLFSVCIFAVYGWIRAAS